ncbi:MAG: glycoside hydrolase family 127 protein [Edaphobacter sp.]|uniref:beta-L-arabinofuranosidase domain-containing protein n=1 Tax=Edaphobacter sp. TaxID=1934404 RepID=UPI0023984E97|nr:beta-L-arabinofuranosidase domain-containing protein [Edaphobacter sp.]MDE1177732.1 glycoside hydrolase family 127 protein [Edaphobacter sp.]
MSTTTRREFLGRGAATLAALSLPTQMHGEDVPAAAPLEQFEYGQVQLLEGPMLEQFRHNHALFLGLNNDSLLKPFRQLAGQSAPGEDMGGWYSPSPDFNPPKNMTGYIPGHSFGQYLSGLSRAYAVTRDPATQQKVHQLVAGFAPTATKDFYSDYCLPAYTFEKTMCGLSDAHQFAQDPSALAVLNKATDAVLPWLPEKALNRKEMAARPHKNVAYTWDESYTLPENFYLAYKRGAGNRYRALAQRFLEDDTYFNPLADGHNVLPGEHAYSHVNALCSAMQAYKVDGSRKHFEAARNGFRFVQEQSFATGGWGPNESFQKPGSNGLADSLTKTHSSFETPCGAYGHFKITRYLLTATGESSYGDSMETVLYNTILGARLLKPNGISFYYADYSNDAAKMDYEQAWPCCSGTFPQLTADYGISSYFRTPQGIAVNLYVPSRVTWKQGSASVSLTQETSYPRDNETALTIRTDRTERFTVTLRVPAWAGAGSRVRINGRNAELHPEPGSWLKIDRTWKNNDRVEFTIDMPLRLIPLDAQHNDVVALMHGPVALFALHPVTGTIPKPALLAARRASTTSVDWHVATDAGQITMRPFSAITTERYRLYQST